MAKGSGEVGRLNVVLEARLSKLEAGLKKAEQKTRATQKNIEKAGEKINPFGGITGAAMKAVAVMGTVELAIKGLNGLSAAFRGEWEDAAEAIKQLPAGIGPVAQGLEGMLARVTGIGEQIARIQDETARRQKQLNERFNALNVTGQAKREVQGMIADINVDFLKATTMSSPAQQAALDVQLSFERRRQKLDQALATARKRGGGIAEDRMQELVAATERAKNQLDDLMRAQLDNIAKVEQTRFEAQNDAARKMKDAHETAASEDGRSSLGSLIERMTEVGMRLQGDLAAGTTIAGMGGGLGESGAAGNAIIRSSALDLKQGAQQIDWLKKIEENTRGVGTARAA